MYMNGFVCTRCGTAQAAAFDGYVCPACGGNLEVTYDYDAIRSALDKENPFPGERQDAFKYAPLLPVNDISLAPPQRIGATPLYPSQRLGAAAGLKRLFFKDDGLNPSASFKDRASSVAITRAREIGAAVVSGASTGNAGSSMACMAAGVQVPCVIFVPESAPAAKIAQLLIFGAKVVAVRGTYDEAFDLCLEVCKRKGWFNRNTGYNPFTREGKKTCSFEIAEQLGWQAPDRVVVPVGDGNIISGIWKGFKDLHAVGLIDRLPRLVCAQSEASEAISRGVWALQEQDAPVSDWSQVAVPEVAATTVADSISVDIPRDGLAAMRAVIESKGCAVSVPDEEILAAISTLARQEGIFSEPAAATAWAALAKLAQTGEIAADETVVCLLTGSGLKDIAGARKVAGDPLVIDPTVEAAEQALKDL
jgi:threonine synthase